MRKGFAMNLDHRPQYHFLPVANWMNDPNGLIQWKGIYHLFYQHNPVGACFGAMHWGHASSHDLVHWRHLPIALAPTPDGADCDGAWSGCAVDANGVPTLIYTGVHPQVQCLATSDDDLIVWQKDPANPVIAEPPTGLAVTGFRDPCVWRDDGLWYMILGSGQQGVGGLILLYRSSDLHDWEYLGPLLEGRLDETGHNWECPNLLPIGDRHLLIFSPEPLRQAHYYIGELDGHRFRPKAHGLLDYGGLYYAPQAFTDQGGRRICFGWLPEGRSSEAMAQAGWAGVQSLPRLLSLSSKGALEQRPIPELEALRRSHQTLEAHALANCEGTVVAGRMLEIDVEMNVGSATSLGLQVLRASDGSEHTTLLFKPAEGRLYLDTRFASQDPGAEGRLTSAPLDVMDGLLRMRVYVDHSVVEVFANERVCLTGRSYPTRADATGVALLSDGGSAVLSRFDCWTLATIWSPN